MDVTIGRCRADDIDDVVRFIDEHWKRGHILASCRPLLDWQHREEDGYAFVIARGSQDGTILGVLGYIATARFDPSLAADDLLWLTLWKVRDDAHVAGLGLQLLQSLIRSKPHRAVGAIFPAIATTPIYRAMGFRVGELSHYVCEAHPERLAPDAEGRLVARRLHSDEDFSKLSWPDRDRIPRKTPEYFRRRYARHPVYAYTVMALFDGGAFCGLLAARTAEHAGSRALRIVDFLGSPEILARTESVVQALLDETGAAYADMYNAGIGVEWLERAGFRKVDPDGSEIVPDNFEPFERRNVRLWFAFKGADHADTDFVLFKGDSDRDRPNRLPAT